MIQRVRGFQDLDGVAAAAASYIENLAARVARLYNFGEIRLPIVERVELYQRSTGETSDIVEKQMYVFPEGEQSEQLIALRPEGTPGVVRAYLEAGLDRSNPEQRFFYSGPMFRRERPQKGRYRQFHQFGVEVFGRSDAVCDAELLVMIDDIARFLNLDVTMEVNSLGCAECRPAYRAALVEWGRAHLNELCEDCHNRIDRNPLRLLDCKIDIALTKQAPGSLDFLCEACRAHFAMVQRLLKATSIEFVINPRLVRGLDYYTRTAFEVLSGDVGSQSAVIAGGRYDGLVEALGGARVPGIGFAIGIERLVLAYERTLAAPSSARLHDKAHDPDAVGAVAGTKDANGSRRVDAVVASLGDAAIERAFVVAHELRVPGGKAVELASPERKLKAALARANKIGARYAVIIGDTELTRGVVQLKDLKAGTQREVATADLIDEMGATT